MCPPLTGIDAAVSAGSGVSARLVWVHAGEPADEELVRLRAENHRLRAERDLLKKARPAILTGWPPLARGFCLPAG